MSIALITMPGVQKPHCSAWFSRNASCIGCSFSALSARPSMVVTLPPSACTARMVHDLIDLPSTWTTQAPHWLVSQPTWVPVSPRCSRRNWTNSVRASTFPDTALPLTVMATLMVIDLLPHIVGCGARTRLPRALPDSRKTVPRRSSELRITDSAGAALTADQEDDDQDHRTDADHGPVLHAALRRILRHRRRRIVGHHHQADSATAVGGGAPTLSANLEKNWPASFWAVPWISRAPTWAILPPTCASTS